MRAAILCALSGILVAAAASAEPDNAPNFAMGNSNAPIEYAADHCDAAAKEGLLVCSGNVVIHQGNVRLRANAVQIHAPDGKSPDKVFAQGHVVIDAPSGTATGDSGIYDVTPRIVTLRSHVVLARDKNVMRGETLTVDLISGVAKLGGGGKPGGRIQGLFTPKTDPGEKK